MKIFIYIFFAYIIGSIPFGYLAGLLKGIDLRQHGSCNIGATNAMRVLGKTYGIAVFFMDFIKGFIPVYLWAHWFFPASLNSGDVWWLYGGMVLTGLSVVLGHTYTCFLHFKGGKGVASTAGILFAISWITGGIALSGWILSLIITRYVSIASITASFVMILASLYDFGFFNQGGFTWRPEILIVCLMVLITSLVIYKHKSNLVRIRQGTEPKVFSKNNN